MPVTVVASLSHAIDVDEPPSPDSGAAGAAEVDLSSPAPLVELLAPSTGPAGGATAVGGFGAATETAAAAGAATFAAAFSATFVGLSLLASYFIFALAIGLAQIRKPLF